MKQILRKLGFRLSIIEAELNLLDAYKKKVYFNQKFAHPYYSLGNSPNTITLNYSVEYLTHIMFCESVLGVSHMPYAEDFAILGKKSNSKSR